MKEILTKEEATELNEYKGKRCITSLKVAEITGKNHSDVLKDIRLMLAELDRTEGTFALEYKPTNSNRTFKVLRLPEREFNILLTGYSTTLRAKLYDALYANSHWNLEQSLELANSVDFSKSELKCIYLILDRDKEAIKIGSSIDPQHRLEALNCGNSITLELVWQSDCIYTISDEFAIHKKMKSKNIIGEWFKLTPDDVAWIILTHTPSEVIETPNSTMTWKECEERLRASEKAMKERLS